MKKAGKGKEKGKKNEKSKEVDQILEEHCLQIILHKTPIHCIVVANGFVYCGAWDNQVHQYDLKTGKCMRVLEGHTGYVHSMCLVNNSLYTASLDRTIRHFDAKSGACRQVYEGHTGMVLAVIQVGNQLYSGSSDCTIREWDTKKAECIKVFTGHTGNVECLAFGDGRLYSGSWDHSIRAWDIATGQCKQVFTGHRSWVLSLQVQTLPAPGGNASGGSGGTRVLSSDVESGLVRVWDAVSGECLACLEAHESAVQSLLLLPSHATPATTSATIASSTTPAPLNPTKKDESLSEDAPLGHGELLTASKDKTIRIWDLGTGECKHTVLGHTGPVHSLQVFEKTIVSASLDHSIRVWDLKSIYSKAKKPPS